MKKKRIEHEEREENAFALSTGDLMAGLLFILPLAYGSSTTGAGESRAR